MLGVEERGTCYDCVVLQTSSFSESHRATWDCRVGINSTPLSSPLSPIRIVQDFDPMRRGARHHKHANILAESGLVAQRPKHLASKLGSVERWWSGDAWGSSVTGSAGHFPPRPKPEGYQPRIGRQDLSVDVTTHDITSAQGPGIGWLRLRPLRIGVLGVEKRRVMCDGRKQGHDERTSQRVQEVTSQLH